MKDWRIALAAAAGTAALIGTAEAVTDTAFTYSQPKTGWYTVVPAELAPISSGVAYAADSQSLRLQTNSSNCFTGGMHLPQGSTITNVTAWHQSGVGGRLSFFLDRVALATGTLEQIAVGAPSDDSNTRKSFSVTPFASTSLVNNGNFNYTFILCPVTTDNIFYGARIAYTYRSAGD
jgi:hypothetical protein